MERITFEWMQHCFKLDTGAEVTAICRRTLIPETSMNKTGEAKQITTRTISARSQGGGQFSGKLPCKAKYTKQLIFVIKTS